MSQGCLSFFFKRVFFKREETKNKEGNNTQVRNPFLLTLAYFSFHFLFFGLLSFNLDNVYYAQRDLGIKIYLSIYWSFQKERERERDDRYDNIPYLHCIILYKRYRILPSSSLSSLCVEYSQLQLVVSCCLCTLHASQYKLQENSTFPLFIYLFIYLFT